MEKYSNFIVFVIEAHTVHKKLTLHHRRKHIHETKQNKSNKYNNKASTNEGKKWVFFIIFVEVLFFGLLLEKQEDLLI